MGDKTSCIYRRRAVLFRALAAHSAMPCKVLFLAQAEEWDKMADHQELLEEVEAEREKYARLG